MIVPSIQDLQYPLNDLGKVTAEIYNRAVYYGALTLVPDDLMKLVKEMLKMLFAGKCRPDPVKATTYLNCKKFYRIHSLRKLLNKNIRAIMVDCPDVEVEWLVRAILFQCEVCSLREVHSLHRIIKGLP